jgi:hypothetical protein
MPDTPVPWVGLAALAAMLLLPLLPDWLFEGPRTSKHWLRRRTCGDCGAPWTDEHTCTPGRTRPAQSFVASCAGFPRLFTAPGPPSTREAPERFRGLVRVQRIRQSPTDWVSQRRLGAHVREVPSRAGAIRALPGHQGEAS